MRKAMNMRLALTLVALTAVGAGSAVFSMKHRARDFSTEAWKAPRQNARALMVHDPRALMVDDLLRNHLKLGMSKDEVVSLLGSPSQPGEKSFWYGIGAYHDRGWLFPSRDELHVVFDERGRVKRAGVPKD